MCSSWEAKLLYFWPSFRLMAWESSWRLPMSLGPRTHMGDPEVAAGSWHLSGSALADAAIQAMNQQMEYLSLSFSLCKSVFPMNKSVFNKNRQFCKHIFIYWKQRDERGEKRKENYVKSTKRIIWKIWNREDSRWNECLVWTLKDETVSGCGNWIAEKADIKTFEILKNKEIWGRPSIRYH